MVCEKRRANMAIKHDPYVIVFKCTFSCTYVIRCILTQWRPTRREDPRAKTSCSQIPPRREFDCHYYSTNPSTSGISIIKKFLRLLYRKNIYILSLNPYYFIHRVLIYSSSSLETLLINNSALEVGSKICEDWDVKSSSYEFYEAFRFFLHHLQIYWPRGLKLNIEWAGLPLS